MIDVTSALDSTHPSVPKFLNGSDEFFFHSGLDFGLEVQLQFMPNVAVGDSRVFQEVSWPVSWNKDLRAGD